MTTHLEKLGLRTHKYRANSLNWLEINNQLICPMCCTNKRAWQVHHYTPVTGRGRDTIYNLVVICSACHTWLTWSDEDEKKCERFERLVNFMTMRWGIILASKNLLREVIKEMEKRGEKMPGTLSEWRQLHKELKLYASASFWASFHEATPPEKGLTV